MGQETPQIHLGCTDGPFWFICDRGSLLVELEQRVPLVECGTQVILAAKWTPQEDMPSAHSGFQILFLTPYWYSFVRVIFVSSCPL